MDNASYLKLFSQKYSQINNQFGMICNYGFHVYLMT